MFRPSIGIYLVEATGGQQANKYPYVPNQEGAKEIKKAEQKRNLERKAG